MLRRIDMDMTVLKEGVYHMQRCVELGGTAQHTWGSTRGSREAEGGRDETWIRAFIVVSKKRESKAEYIGLRLSSWNNLYRI